MGAICETKLRDDDRCVLIFLIFEAEDVYEDILTAMWKAQEVNEGFGVLKTALFGANCQIRT